MINGLNNNQDETPTDSRTDESLHDSAMSTNTYSHNLPSHNPSHSVTSQEEANLIRYNHLTYALYALSFFTAGLLWIVPIVMNYIQRGKANGSWLATHFDWQIKTFWYSIFFTIIGVIVLIFSFGGLGVSALASSTGGTFGSMLMILLGSLIIAFTFFWHLYRILRGWIALSGNRPVP